MEILDRELEDSYGFIEIRPENLDDLWHLTYIIELGDMVSGLSERRIDAPGDRKRSDAGERETMEVTIEVSDIELHRFSNRLRISGIITRCPREDEVGDHHTINLEVNQEITVNKTWRRDQLDRLKEAEKTKQSDVVVVTIHDGEAYIHSIEQHGTEEIVSFTSSSGKGEYASNRDELYKDIYGYLETASYDALVFAGPGFIKKDAVDYIAKKNPELKDEIHLVDTSSVGDRGVQEVLSRGVLSDITDEARITREADLMDELMEQISDSGNATYGVNSVRDAVEFGAVEDLLVVDEYLRENRDQLEDLMIGAEEKGGDVTVLSSEFEPGQRLQALGGVAALLRYPVD